MGADIEVLGARLAGRRFCECVGCRRAGGPVAVGSMPADWFVLTVPWSGEAPGGAVCPTCADTIGPPRTKPYREGERQT